MTQYQRNPAHDTQLFPAATIADMLQRCQQERVAQIIELLANGNTDNNYYVIRSRLGETRWIPQKDERCVYIDVYYTVFQKKPVPTPLDIPWHLIAPKWKCAAMDEDKSVWYYTNNPRKNTDDWAIERGDAASNVLTIDTDGIDWENSLTFRPEGQ